MPLLKNSLILALRILIGCVFLVSGGEKIIGPYQNFLYVIQNYEFLPPMLEEATAHVLPWVELFLGLFLILGLWTKWVMRGLMVLLGMFIAIVCQALIRQLEIVDCGCFGELASFPLHFVALFDTTMLCLLVLLHYKFDVTSRWSLDNYFSK